MASAETLVALLEPAVNDLGFELWGVQQINQGKNLTLRIYIDSEQGISVDDCAAVSHRVSAILDVEDVFQNRYTLEVSSPGLDRSLFKLEQYAPYIGQWLKVNLYAPFEGRRRFKGVLAAIEGDEIVLQIDNEEYVLPFDAIEKANIVAQD